MKEQLGAVRAQVATLEARCARGAARTFGTVGRCRPRKAVAF